VLYSASRPVCRTPETDFYVSPLTVRRTPSWYSACQASISTIIAAQIQDQQTRVLPLPGFLIDPSHLDPDGIHLLPVFGQEYCRHLIDSARYIPTHPSCLDLSDHLAAVAHILYFSLKPQPQYVHSPTFFFSSGL